MIDDLQLMRVPALSDNRTLEIADLPLAESTGERTERAGGGAVPVEPFSGTTCQRRSTLTCVNLALSSRMRIHHVYLS